MESKSLGRNIILNGFRNILNLLFPLVTFPYISRVLGVEEIGKYNFAQSAISYFLLIAGLGISSYAVREGAKYRNRKETFNIFASEILLCNVMSTIIAYIALFVCLYNIKKFKTYSCLMILFSIQIIFTTIGVEWVYSIYEEYEYITIRSIVFKIISIILILVFVRDQGDVNTYAAITVFSSVGSNFMNLIHSKTYFKIVKIHLKDCLKHVKPILIIFASNIAIMIYVYSDTTMLGFITSDYEVGIYSVSVKIYNMIKNLLSSILIVSIPRLSMFYGNDLKEDFKKTTQKVYDTLTTLILPAVVGLFCASRQLVLITSGYSYVSAETSLRILCIALFFCIYGWFFGQCILMPAKKEKIILFATCISAGVNIGLNFILMPIWKENAAAFTTAIAELVMFIICMFYGHRVTEIKIWTKNTISVIVGCILIVCVCSLILRIPNWGNISQLLAMMFFSIGIYGFALLILQNTVACDIWRRNCKRIRSSKRWEKR